MVDVVKNYCQRSQCTLLHKKQERTQTCGRTSDLFIDANENGVLDKGDVRCYVEFSKVTFSK